MTTNVLWDQTDNEGLVLEPEVRMHETLRTIDLLRRARTVGELRRADLPVWAERIVEGTEESLHEEGVDDIDAATWDWAEQFEFVMDAVPLPWDAASVTQWLDSGLLARHADIGGGSPGGHIDTYRVRDPQALLADLEHHGYTIERRPGLVEMFHRAL